MPELTHAELVARWAAVRVGLLRHLQNHGHIDPSNAWLGIYKFLLHNRQPIAKAVGGAQ